MNGGNDGRDDIQNGISNEQNEMGGMNGQNSFEGHNNQNANASNTEFNQNGDWKQPEKPKEITAEDGSVYVLKKPIYKQPLFWVSIGLFLVIIFLTAATLFSRTVKTAETERPKTSDTINQGDKGKKDESNKASNSDSGKSDSEKSSKGDETKDASSQADDQSTPAEESEKSDEAKPAEKSEGEKEYTDESGGKVYTTADHELAPGEIWEVPGQWKLTINSVTPTAERNEFSDKQPKEVFIINYTYENLGYKSDVQDLYVTPEHVIDGTGVMGYLYPAATAYNPQPTPPGASCAGAEAAFGVDNLSDVIKVRFSIYDNDMKKQQVVFSCPTRPVS